MDLLITILTLLVAVYAVIPRERRLDLRIRLDSLDWFVIIVGFAAGGPNDILSRDSLVAQQIAGSF